VPIRISEGPFEPAAELAAFEAGLPRGSVGATASFTGTMRDLNEGDAITGMTLEHYPAMTEKELSRIVAEAVTTFELLDALIVHRVGEILPGEPIVLTVACSAHRAAAFDACRWLMEELKRRAPFWKRERLADGGSRWVERNTPG